MNPAVNRMLVFKWPAAVLVLVLTLVRPDGTATAQGVTVHSRSGQFVVHSPTPTVPSLARVEVQDTNATFTLYPDPLAVSCERIKTAVLAELGLQDRWRGKVHVTIDPRARAEPFPVAAARRFGDGWHYSLRLPREIEGLALIRGVTHAVLLDVANRHPGPHLPEVPIWLVEALTGQVLSRVGPDPLARPNPVAAKYGHTLGQLVATLSERGLADEDRKVLDRIRARGLLTFEELSLPTPDRLTGEALEHYRACCQVFFVALRNLPQGRVLLAAFLARLPHYLNWQTAFLDAYQAVFPRLLDIEKWWALAARRLGAAGVGEHLAPGLGVAWLEDLVLVPVQTRAAPDQPPQRQTLTLQQVIREWEYPRQRALLSTRVLLLRRLAPSLSAEVRALAEGYAATLESYLNGRTRVLTQPALRGQVPVLLAHLVNSTATRLDTLDDRRKALKPPAAWSPSASDEPSATPSPEGDSAGDAARREGLR